MNNKKKLTNILITGWGGLLGYHARAVFTAHNCASAFQGDAEPFIIILAPRLSDTNVDSLANEISKADLVLHLAGINRAEPEIVEQGNIDLANTLVDALGKSKATPHVIYANSTHSRNDSPYGRGKQTAHQIIDKWAESNSAKYTNFILPHIFGENSRPFYNTVTATLCKQVVDGTQPDINPDGKVELIHAGDVIDVMLDAHNAGLAGTQTLTGRAISISALYNEILSFKSLYDSGQYPDLSEDFTVKLFNTFRSFEFPQYFPRELTLIKDPRGTLFEAVKGGGGGQTFVSWTEAGVERGNHFHRHKVERFLVLSGQADIHIRSLFGETIHTFSVTGETPEYVDMPTLHTHSIVNTGDIPLLTLFWAHEIFDREYPDTYAHPVDLSSS